MATAVARPPDRLARYLAAAREAGCPKDQVENFLRARIVLQPRQLAAAAAARLCDAEGGPTEVGYGGARGGGKSHWGLAQLIDDCSRQDGIKCLLLRKVGKANRENFEALRRRLLAGTPHQYRQQAGVVAFPNGSMIVLGHYQNERDIDSYLGLGYEVILTEEATTLTGEKVQDIRSCNRTDLPAWRPRRYFTFNPGGVGHAHFKARFIEPFRRDSESDTRFIPATVRDNRFMNPDYVRVLESYTGWKRKAWLEGDWDISAGQYFTTFRREAVEVAFDGPIPAEWLVFLSLDYGFTHFTAVHLLAKDGDNNLFVVDEHGERGWLVERHAMAIHAMLARHRVQKPDGTEVLLAFAHLRKAVAGQDCFVKHHTGGSIADEYARHGIRLEPANVDRINGAAEILRRLGDPAGSPPIAPTLRIHPRCARLLETLPAMEHDPHRPEDVLKVDCDEDGLGGDDWYDSARYACMCATELRRLRVY
jgi:phage terminase large subunit